MNLKSKFKNFVGRVIKNNSQYVLQDWEVLNNLTISKTSLHVGQQTNGHKHDGLEEVYLFVGELHQEGTMWIDDLEFKVHNYDIVAVPAGAFHKVRNDSPNLPLEFIAIFQKYDRE